MSNKSKIHPVKQETLKLIKTKKTALTTDLSKLSQDEIRKLRTKWGKKGGDLKAKTHAKWDERYVKQVYEMAKIGMRQADMASIIGITDRTFRGWKKRFAHLKTALKKGEAERNENLLSSMVQAALGGNVIAQIWLSKNWLGYTDKIERKGEESVTFIYQSHIPDESGSPAPDQESIKGKLLKNSTKSGHNKA